MAPPPHRLRDLPPEERPRERLVRRGAAGLSAAELIGLVWGSGSPGRSAIQVATEALARAGSLSQLAAASPPELEAIPGIGDARAAQLAAAFELGRRLLADWPTGRLTVRAPGDLADRLILQMGRLEREELRVVALNTRNAVLAIETVYRGNVSTALVRVGELFRDAIRQHAAGLILVHNHPSGDPTPSRDDVEMTKAVAAAAEKLGILLHDHLVVGRKGHKSLRALKLI